MPEELTFLSALLVGFVGSTHCLGMCGGIAGTLAASADSSPTRSIDRFLRLLTFNLGRVTSYTLAGALAGGIGFLGSGFLSPHLAHGLAVFVSVVFLVALGFYLAGWASFLPVLERIGARLWLRLEPIGRRWIPITTLKRAFGVGLVWGWLPCGLVYSVLAWSLLIGNATQGALLMLGFGLGTLPTVLCMGLTGQTLERLRRNPAFRQAAGVSLILFAAVMIALYSLNPHTADKHHQFHDHAQLESG